MNWLRRLLLTWFRRDPEQIALEGTNLSDAEAADLEADLAKNPEDVPSRLELLGYLCQRRFLDKVLGPKRTEHALWFIRQDPGGKFTGSPFCHILPSDHGYETACEAWDKILAAPEVTAKVLMNAAHFFQFGDPQRTQSLLELGEQLDPSSPEWAEQLGENLFRKVAVARSMEDSGKKVESTPDHLKETAAGALVHFERALRVASSDSRKFQILPRCAKAALEAGRRDEAIRYADETIALAPRCPDDRHRPDFIHWAHSVRGLTSLQSGDVDAACRELKAAGKQGGLEAPVLRSFGPEFRLARLLLERGRKEAVLSYLDRCATFWNPKRIARWRSEIERGGLPFMFTGFDPDEPPADRRWF